jgi:hypothetical protein
VRVCFGSWYILLLLCRRELCSALRIRVDETGGGGMGDVGGLDLVPGDRGYYISQILIFAFARYKRVSKVDTVGEIPGSGGELIWGVGRLCLLIISWPDWLFLAYRCLSPVIVILLIAR